MKLRNSDLFDEYARTMIGKGFGKKAEDRPSLNRTKEDISSIELLYGIDPNKEKSKGKNIVEEAHPDSVYVAPAYDKVNSLVENVNERHNIMVGIVNKPVNGLLTNHIYAQANKELLNEVIKVGFMLDRTGHNDLMDLADDCSIRLVEKTAAINKTAFSGLAIAGIVAAVVAPIGILYWENNPDTQGLKNDIDRTIVEMNEAIEDYPQLGRLSASFFSKIQQLQKTYQEIVSSNDDAAMKLLDYTTTAPKEQKYEEVVRNVVSYVDSGATKTNKEKISAFKESSDAVGKAIPIMIELYSNAEGKYEESSSEVWSGIKKFWRSYVINSDTEDAVRMLGVLGNSLRSAGKIIDKQFQYMSDLEKIKGDASMAIAPKRDTSKREALLADLQDNEQSPGPSSAMDV